MSQTLLELAHQLTQAGKPFLLATVVWCERPTSAKPGAQAIIQDDGQGGLMAGWVGGSCTQPVVLREALRSLRAGDDPYLLRVGAPDKGIMRQDVRVFPMTCASGGVIDIYMEPHLPQPRLVLVGASPVAHTLAQLAPVLNFAVTSIDSADLSQLGINEQTYILVATHGQYDEDVLEQALRSPARYVGMVASHRRADTIRAYLRTSKLTEPQIARLKAPAGLDTGAVTPEEIAASILAELVQVRRHGQVGSVAIERNVESKVATEITRDTEVSSSMDVTAIDGTAVDPVCDMIVEIAGARHHSTYDGREFYFCCPACKRSFERNPQEYLVPK
ncbi:MAG: hypothetical protein NVS4B9_15690 [Ktedonobacteraceae bacterium]